MLLYYEKVKLIDLSKFFNKSYFGPKLEVDPIGKKLYKDASEELRLEILMQNIAFPCLWQ